MGAWLPVNATEEASGRGRTCHCVAKPGTGWVEIPHAPTEDWAVAFGGRLYDNWAQATFIGKPEGDHPAYPKMG